MGGLSLSCGDCGVLLRSTKEAQDHAELTGHANFVESTQAVLSLVCSTCSKPCRSHEEVEIHKVRTGHMEYSDKTAEVAKPLDLEIAGSSEAADYDNATGNSESHELVVPTVNEDLKSELEGMGFPLPRAIRALHFSGNSTLEGAINWIVEHENDPDIDDIPMVPAASASKLALSTEEAKAKAKELLEKARKKKEEEEKHREREREKERIRIGKEMVEAKKIEEEQERKRIMQLRKAEKLEEKRARDRIKAKIEEDKIERRRKLGLPPLTEESKKEEKVPEKVPEEKMASSKVKPVTKAESLRSLLREMKHQHQSEDARVKTAFQTLFKFVGNVATAPNEEKFRKIRISNPAFQERVGSLKNGEEFLVQCGFKRADDGEHLTMAREAVDVSVLNVAGDELNKAMTNPFFGVLK